MISIIAPTYNRPEKLRKAIESTLSNSTEIKHYVCSDGYDYEVEKICVEYQIEYFYTKHIGNWGCFQRNYLLDKISNEGWLLYLDDDNYLDKSAIDNLVNNIKSETGIIIGQIKHELAGWIPQRNEIKLGKIDTLNMFIRSEIAKKIKWDGTYYEHDYGYIIQCNALCLLMGYKLIHIQDIIGFHGGKN
jgi:glycosyltransferase involved in cell wall biosynthesis